MITVAACASSDDVDQYDDVQGQVVGLVAVSASSGMMISHIRSIQTPSDQIASSPHLIK